MPVVALMVSVDENVTGGEFLSKVFVEESPAGVYHHFVVGGDSGQNLNMTEDGELWHDRGR